MLAHGTTTVEGKTGYGLSREGELRAARLARPGGVRPRHGAVRARDPGGSRRRELDGRGRLARRGGERRRARHLRRVGRLPQRGPRAAGRDRAARGRAAARARGAVQHQPLGAGRAGGRRALGRPPRVPAPRGPEAARRRGVRGRAPPRRRVPRRRGARPGPRAGRRGRDLRAGHRLQSRHVARAVAAADHRAGRAPLRLDARARRSLPARTTPPGCSGTTTAARSRSASAPTSSCSTRRSSTSPTASAATRSPR